MMVGSGLLELVGMTLCQGDMDNFFNVSTTVVPIE